MTDFVETRTSTGERCTARADMNWTAALPGWTPNGAVTVCRIIAPVPHRP